MKKDVIVPAIKEMFKIEKGMDYYKVIKGLKELQRIEINWNEIRIIEESMKEKCSCKICKFLRDTADTV